MYVLITYNFYFQNYKDINEMNFVHINVGKTVLQLQLFTTSWSYCNAGSSFNAC